MFGVRASVAPAHRPGPPLPLVLFISGLNLHAGEAREALGCWRGVAWGLLSTLVLTPLLGYGLRAVPLTPPELTTGLVSMVACPTTFGIGER